ncbi:MAG: UDP-N-acetylmuramoyl-L-alanyl-D-glutamate--2,6-diaminopimelate ligase, partial [Erysipelotrichaceae bacterium]|nr:UDP-N-acetylmuramoyl-L-alanyl-D-glutamate--2,6-diaminopimelate ligase [Erysipelotrichaceae bacterium]
ALRDLLEYAKETTDSYHRIIAVYGFNQKSEKSFRQKAIQLLNKYCDMLVLTENDSGDRDPNELNKMFLNSDSIPHVLIEKREEAIFSALMLANSADCVLLLGKGNEKYINRSLGNESYAGDSDLAKKYLQQLMNN